MRELDKRNVLHQSCEGQNLGNKKRKGKPLWFPFQERLKQRIATTKIMSPINNKGIIPELYTI